MVPKLNLLATLPENRSSKSSVKSIHEVKEESNPFIPKLEVKEEVKLLEDRPFKPQTIMTPKMGQLDYSNLDFLLDPNVDFDPNMLLQGSKEILSVIGSMNQMIDS